MVADELVISQTQIEEELTMANVKGIPPILRRPDILSVLVAAGHGTKIVIADAGFPAEDCVGRDKVVYATGRIHEYVEAILQLRALDHPRYGGKSAAMMNVDECDHDNNVLVEAYNANKARCQEVVTFSNPERKIECLSREIFYALAQQAALVIRVIDDETPYGNVLLTLAA